MLDKNSELLFDVFLSRLSMTMGGLDAIDTPDEMEKDLRNVPLLKENLKTIMSHLTPLIPYLGIFTGCVVIGKHVWESEQSKQSEQSED